MKLIFNAHAVVWTVDDPPTLGSKATTALRDPANDLIHHKTVCVPFSNS